MDSLKLHEVAIAILHQDDKFLMQLRDNIPGILYPGHWGLFGGHIEPGETADQAVRRELMEEIGYVPPVLTKFCCDPATSVLDGQNISVIRHVYAGTLAVELHELVLGEGCDMALLSPEDIYRGDRYSAQADRVCPLGQPHQQLLLKFLATP
jgi:8-oxo-dGTP pyrophosphatase MutT (NUDIX family)